MSNITEIKLNNTSYSISGMPDAFKTALLQLASKVAYIDADGQDYYDELESTLYPGLSSISCVYTQTGTVYTTDTLDSLKSDLVVTAHYTDSSSNVLSDSEYILSGTLAVGTSTITVIYGSKTTSFNVTVTSAYSITNALTNVINSNSATYATSGSSYSATLSASTQQGQIQTVTITMGGTDITSTAYNNGSINIASVTGDIVITAIAYLAYYDTNDGDMTIVNGGWEYLSAISGELLSNTANQNSRRSLYIDSGDKPVYRGTQQSYAISNYYPIAVPVGASSVTVSCDKPEHYNAVGVVKLTTNGYTSVGYGDFVQGAVTLTFNADSDLYIMTNSKRASGYNYNTDDPAPSRFTVVFT